MAVFDSATRGSSLVVLTDIEIEGDHIIIPISIDNEFKRFTIHSIPSVYKRERTYQTVIGWSKNNLLRYIDEKRVDQLFGTANASTRTPRVQFPHRELINSSNHKVVLKSELVKKYPKAFTWIRKEG